MNPKIDEYIAKAKKWQAEMEELRKIILDCGLTEELKWRAPCYTYKGKNMVMIAPFKDCCALSFIKGVLLADTYNLLVSPGVNSQSVRFAKFTTVADIKKNKVNLKAYIFEAIVAEDAGLKVDFKESTDLVFPEELLDIFAKNRELKKAFEALTPGRQRAYNMHFSAAKQSQTRMSRIENNMPRIIAGKGLNDCVCGLSKRMPYCDGSHKLLEKK